MPSKKPKQYFRPLKSQVADLKASLDKAREEHYLQSTKISIIMAELAELEEELRNE